MGRSSRSLKCAPSQWELSGSYKSGQGRNSSCWKGITKHLMRVLSRLLMHRDPPRLPGTRLELRAEPFFLYWCPFGSQWLWWEGQSLLGAGAHCRWAMLMGTRMASLNLKRCNSAVL